ncbi:hypothetical protein WAB17_10725 [Parerythrobacter aurantius]|uniref:hypothetical protein n=1 Tax=Parerythrobacter aurantius TaxID=3127706 RepID=UPI00324DC8F5
MRKISAVSYFILAAAMAWAAPSWAQVGASQGTSAAGTYSENRVMTRAFQQDLSAIVRANGDTLESEGELGDVSVIARTSDGLVYVIIGTVCDLPDYGPGCLGVDFQVRYDGDDRITADNINTANLSYSAAKVSRGLNESGTDTLFVTHYTMLDGGQNMGNLKVILINLLDIAPKVSAIIWP